MDKELRKNPLEYILHTNRLLMSGIIELAW